MAEGVHVRVGGERYALSVEDVREIAARGALTAVPGAPAVVAGVRNLRGSVLPVVDLALILGLGASAPAGAIVVTAAGGLTAGLAVDEVIGVEPLPADLEPSEEWGVHGRALADGELVGVLDAGALLRAAAEPGG